MAFEFGSDQDIITGDDTNEVLAHLSTSMVLDNLSEQVSELKKSGRPSYIDYIDVFDSKYNFLYQSYKGNTEIIQQLDDSRDDFYERVKEIIENETGLHITFNNIILKEDFYGYIRSLYRFFVLSFTEKVKAFYINTFKNQDISSLAKAYNNQVNTKDLYFKLYRKDLSYENASVMYNLRDILNSFEVSVIEDFIERAIEDDPEEYDNFSMKEIFITNEATNDVTCNMTVFKELLNKVLDGSFSGLGINSEIFKFLVSLGDN